MGACVCAHDLTPMISFSVGLMQTYINKHDPHLGSFFSILFLKSWQQSRVLQVLYQLVPSIPVAMFVNDWLISTSGDEKMSLSLKLGLTERRRGEARATQDLKLPFHPYLWSSLALTTFFTAKLLLFFSLCQILASCAPPISPLCSSCQVPSLNDNCSKTPLF